MASEVRFSKDVLQLDVAAESERLVEAIRQTVLVRFRRKGAVVGVSGGVDSATVLALTARALGADRALALIMPEKDSSPDSEVLAREVAAQLGVGVVKEDMTAALSELGCYERRDAAVREVFRDYDPRRDRVKIVLPGDLLDQGGLNVFSLVRVSPEGGHERQLLSPSAYLGIVAASNMKQRTRMLTLYYHAERRNYAVVGTANKNEHGQGFFVKYGDGGVDVQPIQHLYKTQVYQLARHLRIPQRIIDRTPSSDTYSEGCSQEEFYFRLPFELMDVMWYGLEHEVPARMVARELGLSEEQVGRAYRDLARKARATQYLRTDPISFAPE